MADPLPWPTLDPPPATWFGEVPPEVVAVWRRSTVAQRMTALRALQVTARRATAGGERLRRAMRDARVRPGD